MVVWTEGKLVSSEGKNVYSSNISGDSQSSVDDVREGKWIIGRTKYRSLEETIRRDWGGFLPGLIVIVGRVNDFRITENSITQRGG
jgi:hypothetical protein